MMNKKKHPFYQHSDGEFFIAEKDGQIVGKIGVFINTLFNDYHQTKKGQFYFFDSINDQEVAESLFNTAFDYCRQRGMDDLVGPKGLSAFDGYGILYDGFDHHQMMTMMNYNYPYYSTLLENIGFEKKWILLPVLLTATPLSCRKRFAKSRAGLSNVENLKSSNSNQNQKLKNGRADRGSV